MPSRIEQTKATLVSEFQTIQPANGYRNDVKSVLKIIRHPDEIKAVNEIGFYFGRRVYEQADAARRLFNINVDCTVQVVMRVDQGLDEGQTLLEELMESWLHDMGIFMTSVMMKYVAAETNPFNISFDTGAPVFFPFMPVGEKKNKAAIVTDLNVKVRSVRGSTHA